MQVDYDIDNIFDIFVGGIETGFEEESPIILYLEIMVIYFVGIEVDNLGAKIQGFVDVATGSDDQIGDLVHVWEQVHFYND